MPAIRGLARGRSLIVVDGSRVSTERRAGANASFLDPAVIGSMEIARGPGSVAYGSDAFGGVIAARTRKPSYRSPLRVRAAATLGGGLPERRGDVELSAGYGSGGVLVAVRAREFGDYRAPSGVVPNSGWRDGGVRAMWEHDTGTRAWSARWQTDLGRSIGRPRSDSATILATSPTSAIIPTHHATPELRSLTWTEHEGTRILLAPNARTMAINSQMDLARTPQPPLPRKFSPGHPDRIRVLVDTAEERVLYNPSLTLWGHTDLDRFPQRGSFLGQYRSYPVGRIDGQARFWRDHEFPIVTHAADHPFHIHVNPMWVMRIEVPDEQGRLHNVLDAPRWMDTVTIPRNGGRVVFRTRFADYTGRWIHHCHILMHEDMGMMQEVECVASADSCNANPRDRVAGHGMTDAEVSDIYPRPSVEIAYRQGLSFVDPNPNPGRSSPGLRSRCRVTPCALPRLDYSASPSSLEGRAWALRAE